MWIRTYTGKKFYPTNPMEEHVDIKDIAHALSLLCRFTGHCKKFYSIAQHSIHVAELCPPKYRLYGLLHDASEAYMHDLATPIKERLPEYKVMENYLLAKILRSFGLDPQVPRLVKSADLSMLCYEANSLLPLGLKGFNLPKGLPEQLGLNKHKIVPWYPEKAEKEFLKKFREYSNEENRNNRNAA